MSRSLAAVAAAFAFTALVGAAPGAHAQAQSDMVAPGATPGTSMPGTMPRGPAMSPAARGTMPSGEMSQAPMHRGAHSRAMREERRERQSARREMRANRRAANDPDGAYMGGGGVFERAPDGSLRPVM
ncbi:hypothetical protein EAH89_13830 [Roseomonas nepalensis]|uniref:Uncharacterized protein n=1 Tax=Muricoccus nepalensis TaxID=1854500 RepID=A0A502G139_9PROT|nr:hypothetical protein [Roseomonas nepalensis]TPG55647.1 hypothetical protein EAH89_13830 [Roseomonas nepalensis]